MVSRGAARGRKKSIELMKQIIAEEIPPDIAVDFAVCHTMADKEALELKEYISATCTLNREVFISRVSPVGSVHIGLGVLGVAYIIPETRG